MKKYELPDFLVGIVSSGDYEMWLHRKASAHVRRDRKRGQPNAKIEQYKVAIHDAVKSSNGVDAYTGERLEWKLLRQYDNDQSQTGGTAYKKGFALLPSLDHVPEEKCQPSFKICAWRTNDAKSDLSYVEFLDLCKKVVKFAKRS